MAAVTGAPNLGSAPHVYLSPMQYIAGQSRSWWGSKPRCAAASNTLLVAMCRWNARCTATLTLFRRFYFPSWVALLQSLRDVYFIYENEGWG